MAGTSTPPKAMTWTKAAPALVIAVIADAIRVFFEWLGFLGPVIAGAVTIAALNSSGWTSWLPEFVKNGVGAAAGIAATAASPGLEAFGIVMSMAIGFLGWLIVGGWIAGTNMRIFKSNAMNLVTYVAALGVDEIPFVSGFVPGLTLAVWRMYHTQIKKEKAALKKWTQENAAALQDERQQQADYLLQQYQQNATEEEAQEEAEEDSAEQEAAEEEAANDAFENSYGNTYDPATVPEPANENEEIPEVLRNAA